ncbi:hypothetical protein ABT56_15335 [Photobacterium aquae]|uniref:Type IV pilin n=1 Tax=Photobacterium aquae TaxID=1195763 RepID=A0A0J1GYF0_9GAMM|nr:prepilin-type N-terminal cleavage/methylation domain-containing protein [Photobacterium aquae]KLV04499.1 hypothetical protein ABT56_15335 [Photobacterium aquae]
MISKRGRGFSLIEVLVSLLLISVSFAAVMRMQAYVEVKREQAALQYQAMQLAEQQVMLWQNVGATVNCNGTMKALTLANLETCQIGFGKMTGTVSVVGTPKKDLAGAIIFKRLQVAVQWIDRSGEKGTVTLYSGHSNQSPLLK